MKKFSLYESALPSSAPLAEQHPFGGCERLRGQYQTIGRGLLELERQGAFSLMQRGLSLEKDFREGIAFVPVEVLESYFDDLLDPEVTDERLSIAIKSWGHRVVSHFVAILGVTGALLTALYVASLGVSLPLSFLLALSLALPFATILYYTAGGATRRLRFAQTLSREISRRRGSSSDRDGLFGGATVRLRELLQAQSSQPAARVSVDLLH